MLNPFLIIIGLILCFAGVYTRKLCAASLGFTWGTIASLLVIIVTEGFWGLGEYLTIALGIGIGLAVAGLIWDRFFMGVEATLSSFCIVLVVIGFMSSMDKEEALLASAAVSAVIGLVAYLLSDFSFVLNTAISGAFMASVGACAITQGYDYEDLILEFLMGEEALLRFVVLGTLILGFFGMIVQFNLLAKQKAAQAKSTDLVFTGEADADPIPDFTDAGDSADFGSDDFNTL